MSAQQRRFSNNQQRLQKQIFQSIAVKFILNLPQQQKTQKARLAYHYQKAYYYYIDEVLKQLFPHQDPKKVQTKWFYDQLNTVVGEYMKKVNAQDVIKIMSQHKPTCGAIILNQKQTKVLVIQGGGKYGFPKGGKDQNDTAEECAARQTRQQVGLQIHNYIKSNDKLQFAGRDDAPVIFFIVRGFDQNQPLKIDKKQLDDAFWMNVDLVSKLINKFSFVAKSAWKLFQKQLQIHPKISMDQFLQTYRDKGENNCKNKKLQANPLLNFSLDKQKLFAVFKTIES